MSRVRELQDGLLRMEQQAEGLIDMVASWGLPDAHDAGLTVTQAMQSALLSTGIASRAVRAEADRFDDEDGQRYGGFIVTANQRRFWPLDPRAEEVNLDDIAHALSFKCRWGCFSCTFHSVAEHSLSTAKVARWIACGEPRSKCFMVELMDAEVDAYGPGFARDCYDYALVHDCEEAYLPDVPRPIKPFLPGWAQIADRVQRACWEALYLPPPSPEVAEVVALADNVVLLIEKDRLFLHAPEVWEGGVVPHVAPRLIEGAQQFVTAGAYGVEDITAGSGISGAFDPFLRALEMLRDRRRAEAVRSVVTAAAAPPEDARSWRDEVQASAVPDSDCRICGEGPAGPFGICDVCEGR